MIRRSNNFIATLFLLLIEGMSKYEKRHLRNYKKRFYINGF